MVAYAVRITSENKSAIASEHPKFNEEEFEEWLRKHQGGYFLRDPSSSFDCRYFDEEVFLEMYAFDPSDLDQLFRRVWLI